MKKYNIPNKMINKNVRLIGSTIRAFSPPYSEKIFHMQNEAIVAEICEEIVKREYTMECKETMNENKD